MSHELCFTSAPRGLRPGSNGYCTVVASRGLPFELVERLEWETALVVEDIRKDYGETRPQVLALMEGRLYAAVVTPRGVLR